MNHLTTSLAHKIDKKSVTAMTIFAINNIPDTDEFTLKKFLELMNTTGSFGLITDRQIIEIMRLMMKYVPDTCGSSLLILIELLDVYLPLMEKNNDFLIAANGGPKLINSGQKRVSSVAFQHENKQ